MIKTLNELRTASDSEVLACVDEIRASRVKTTDFQKTFGTEYVYPTLINELTARGYTQRWVKNKEGVKEIKIKPGDETEELHLDVTKECKKRYEKFLEDKSSYDYIHTTAAIMNYLDEVEKGEIKVSIEVI